MHEAIACLGYLQDDSLTRLDCKLPAWLSQSTLRLFPQPLPTATSPTSSFSL